MNKLVLVATAAVALISIACKKESAPAEPDKAPEQASTGAETPAPPPKLAPETPPPLEAPPAGTQPTITLLEPGAEPRRELRYSPKVGQELRVEFVFSMEIETRLKGTPGPATKMPPMEMAMATRVTGAEGDRFTYTFEIVRAGVSDPGDSPPELAKAISEQLGKTKGLRGTATVDSRGFTHDAALELPPEMPEQLKQLMASLQQSMEQLSSPLPAEPVGKGAKWRLEQRIAQSGMVLSQSSVFEIAGVSDKQIELKVSIEQSADAQGLSSMPGATLNKLRGTGSGETTIALDRLAPKKASVQVASDLSMSMSLGSGRQDMETRSKMSMQLASK